MMSCLGVTAEVINVSLTKAHCAISVGPTRRVTYYTRQRLRGDKDNLASGSARQIELTKVIAKKKSVR